jgi:hypothetical protein
MEIRETVDVKKTRRKEYKINSVVEGWVGPHQVDGAVDSGLDGSTRVWNYLFYTLGF